MCAPLSIAPSATMSSALDMYKTERDALIADDRSLRLDSRKGDTLTDTEIRADRIIRDLRSKGASSIWSADYNAIPHPFPGMEFLTGKSIIVKTELFKILTKVRTLVIQDWSFRVLT